MPNFVTPPVAAQKVLADNGTFVMNWYQWFAQTVSNLLQAPFFQTAVPPTSTSAGNFGQSATDGTYLYLCIAKNSWKRIALTNF